MQEIKKKKQCPFNVIRSIANQFFQRVFFTYLMNIPEYYMLTNRFLSVSDANYLCAVKYDNPKY